MKIYNIYTTNVWHKFDSRKLIGVSTENALQGPINMIRKYISKNKLNEISKDDMFNLVNILQTQNYTEGFEFLIEEIETDKLL